MKVKIEKWGGDSNWEGEREVITKAEEMRGTKPTKVI